MTSEILAEIPGTIAEVSVREGQMVEAGQQILALESMKMIIPVLAGSAGKVVRLPRSLGTHVQEGDSLATFTTVTH
ncbi:acetyl-CoA carboxylase biotin carboxyl carrier protein subunit [Saccharomonospora sp. NPDC006951]